MLSPSPFSTNNVGRVHPEFFFSEFRYCEVWQEGERQENFEKDALFNKGTQRLQKIVITALLSPRTLVQDCKPLRRFLLGRPFLTFRDLSPTFAKSKVHFLDLEMCCVWSTFLTTLFSPLRWGGSRGEPKECLHGRLGYSLQFISLRNGPDKNDSTLNGNEHVGMQKRC